MNDNKGMKGMRPGMITGLAAAALLVPVQTASAQEAVTGIDAVAAYRTLGFAAQEPNFLSIQGIGGARTAPGGSLFLSVEGSDRRPGGLRELDGSLAFGAGFGDQETGLGGEIAVELTSTEPEDFADSGYLSAKVGGRVLRGLGQNYLALGAEGLAPWGDARGREVNVTLTGTHVDYFGPIANGRYYPVMVSLGYGSRQKRGTDPGLFAGIGVGLTPNISVSLASDAGQIDAGIGLRLERFARTTFMFTAHDLAQADGKTRFSISIGIATDRLFGKGRS